VRFGREVPTHSAFSPRPIFVDTDARTLARQLLTMAPDDYAAAFRGSAIKRAKLWMLQRNAAAVLANVGTDEDLPVLYALRDHDHAVVREQVRAAVAQIVQRGGEGTAPSASPPT